MSTSVGTAPSNTNRCSTGTDASGPRTSVATFTASSRISWPRLSHAAQYPSVTGTSIQAPAFSVGPTCTIVSGRPRKAASRAAQSTAARDAEEPSTPTMMPRG